MNGTKLYQRIAIVPIVALGLAVAGCNKQAVNGTATTAPTTNTATTTTTQKNTTLNYSKNSPLDTTNMFTQNRSYTDCRYYKRKEDFFRRW